MAAGRRLDRPACAPAELAMVPERAAGSDGPVHVPVLAEELLELMAAVLGDDPEGWVVDDTVGAGGHAARVLRVGLARDRVYDIADNRQCRMGHERVDPGRLGVGDNEHVARVYRLPSPDARPVEPETFFEGAELENVCGNAEMLPHPHEIQKTEVYDLDPAVFNDF